MTIPEEVLDGAVSNRFYLNGESGEGSSQECDDEAPTALFVVMMAAASLIREHAREVTRFIIEGNADDDARNKTDDSAESLSCHLAARTPEWGRVLHPV